MIDVNVAKGLKMMFSWIGGGIFCFLVLGGIGECSYRTSVGAAKEKKAENPLVGSTPVKVELVVASPKATPTPTATPEYVPFNLPPLSLPSPMIQSPMATPHASLTPSPDIVPNAQTTPAP